MPKQPTTEPCTRQIWLLGHPVGHSLSPRLHNAAFQRDGLPFCYTAIDVLPTDLSLTISRMRTLGVRGANITVPHKEAVISLLDHMEPEAAKIGAANTIVSDDGYLRGHNTDVVGFHGAMLAVMPAGARGLSCLVVGAGGAAKAVVAALLLDVPGQIWVANRTFERAEALCAMLAQGHAAHCEPLSLDQAARAVKNADLVVNATSLGLPHTVKDFPLDVDTLHSGQVLIDLVYGDRPTPLVLAARARGVLAIDGKEMLIQQAARSYQLWTGRKAPLDVMRESIAVLEG